MTMTDPIADMLTRIRNANMVRHEKLEVPASNVKKEIAEILKREGFVRDVEYANDDKQGIIRIFLKYGKDNERVITGLKRISKPGLRVYAKTNFVGKRWCDCPHSGCRLIPGRQTMSAPVTAGSGLHSRR